MKSFLQGLGGVAMAMLIFWVGFTFGRASGPRQVSSGADPFDDIVPHIPKVVRVEVSGIPSPLVDCLRYVEANFKEATVGHFARVCHGR